jgi:hypothetical protein
VSVLKNAKRILMTFSYHVLTNICKMITSKKYKNDYQIKGLEEDNEQRIVEHLMLPSRLCCKKLL